MRRQHQLERIVETLYVILSERNQTIEQINQGIPGNLRPCERTTRRDIAAMVRANWIGKTQEGRIFAKVKIILNNHQETS